MVQAAALGLTEVFEEQPATAGRGGSGGGGLWLRSHYGTCVSVWCDDPPTPLTPTLNPHPHPIPHPDPYPHSPPPNPREVRRLRPPERALRRVGDLRDDARWHPDRARWQRGVAHRACELRQRAERPSAAGARPRARVAGARPRARVAGARPRARARARARLRVRGTERWATAV